MYFIGYDIGSSSVKGCLLDGSSNTIVAQAQYPQKEMPIHAAKEGWAEQDPEMWWDAIKKITTKIINDSRVDIHAIRGIGISYQMHGLVLVDKNLNVLRPSIIWCDSRAVAIGEEAYDSLGEAYCHNSLLNSPGNFTASKLAWVKKNEPACYAKIHKFMLPGDYIAMKLSGETTTTFSGLSEGIFYDFVNDDLSSTLFDYHDFDRSHIPDIKDTFSVQCELSAKAANALGLTPGIAISYRAGDQPNNALSLNVLSPGELAATAGTSGVIYGVSDSLKNDPKSRVNAFAHVNHSSLQRRIGILLCINGTGIMYSWANKNLKVDTYVEMNALARSVDIGSKGLRIIPFGNGAERILDNRQIGAQFCNLQLNIHDRRHVMRAIKEGIACSLKYGVDIMTDMGIRPKVIRAGNANLFLSDIFQEAISNLVGAEIELYDTDGSHGAARGAAIGYGYYSFDNAFDGLKIIKTIEPDHKKQEAYSEVYASWSDYLSKSLSI